MLETLILIGGKGTRLKSIVSDKPKPMAEISGRPFLEWLILSLRKKNIQKLILAAGYKAEMIEEYFGNGANWGVEISYSYETEPMGTAGAVRNALSKLSGSNFIVLNGDSFCNFNLSALTKKHINSSAQVTMVLIRVNDRKRFGLVEIDKDGVIIGFKEKVANAADGLINAGIYMLSRQFVETIPAGRKISLESEMFPEFVGKGFHGIVSDGYFIDIGTPESYIAAQRYFPEGEHI